MIVWLAASAFAGATWTAQVGGEFNAQPHGIANVGFETETVSAGLITDTLEVRYKPSGERGRGWVAGRVELGAAGLMISPWTDGAPDPGRALLASYAGVDAGALRYLPHGFYVGVMGWVRGHHFAPMAQTVIAVPPVQLRARPELVVGWWSEVASAWATAGAEWAPAAVDAVQPGVSLTAAAAPDWLVAPRAELRAGVARGRDAVSRTRLGGLNPYVVPLAGATWAEFWVEDYAALRAGHAVHLPSVDLAVVVDQAWFDGQSATGFGALVDVAAGAWGVSVHGGWAPWLPRREPAGGLAVYSLVERTF